ncbi:YkgJ family cysteine cluster protein [Haloplanus sp.]|uniref:YkgJ family cysteine cluster protein n=1 Tax=Haloplanus sp. TaxID=1961696 RepID=UPI0026105D46|nr:YkgJ family cysteine cluster protein [Haloplanus sp.]
MESLESELDRARNLDVSVLADAVESIGFECTRCGACCKSEADDPHTATVFPDEVRDLQDATDRDWRDVARPMPYGLREGPDGPEGETFEWALETDACGDCVFYEEADGDGTCTVHGDRPLLCETYPFSVALGGTSQPMGEAVDEAGMVRAHECEGLGRDISRADAEAMARTLKERAIRELTEAVGVRDNYDPADVDTGAGEVVVHDSEGPKRSDGTPR